MVTKLFGRPQSLSSTILSGIHFFPKCSLAKPVTLCLISSSPAATTTTTTTAPILTLAKTRDTKLSYGPSLHQSAKPIKYQNHQSVPAILEEECVINEEAFTRVFNLTAIRVPSKDCFALENRLRGHLLNWPRIRNIARVPGDEVEDGLVKLLGMENNSSDRSDNEGDYASLNRRIHGKAEGDGELLSPVLYRDRLAKTFDSQGFVKFRNLAKLSRPKKKRRKEEERGKDKKRTDKNDFAKVEVVEDEEEGNDLRGLLGEEFKNKRWTGSTRLLLLDHRYGDKGLEELPDAIKAVLKEDTGESMTSTFDLVKCKLTLFYNYWQMDEILEALLPEGMVIPSAFETVGHIAHLNLRDEHLPYKKLIAKVVLDKNKPKIQTVVNKIDAIHNDYRTMQLEVLAGNHSLVTTVIENGLRFHVDLANVYWNSRLATERLRLLSCFSPSDVVCDVFSGVGPIAIAAAKKVKRVYANDLNPYAVESLESNSVLNKLERKIKVFNMDGRRFIDAMFTSDKAKSITQVVMNLPNGAAEFLDAFRGVFRDKLDERQLQLPMIHVYGFSKAHDPEFDFHERIRIALSEVAVDVAMHKVRLVAPGKWMLRASFILPKSVAFAKKGRLDLE